MITPEQLEQQLQSDKIKRSTLTNKLGLQKAFSVEYVQQSQSLKGLDRLNQQITAVTENIKAKAVTEIQSLSSELNIQNITSPSATPPDNCPTPEILRKVLLRRDNLMGDVESAASFVQIVGTILDNVTNVLTGTETTLQVLNILKTATATAIQAAPVVPGPVTTALSVFDDVRTLITFKADGTPKLTELKRALELGSNYSIQAGGSINKILQTVGIIDQTLVKCGQKPGKIGLETLNLASKGSRVSNNLFETSYKGFLFNVVNKPFSPTVNRTVGQATNSQGIVLLETEPSFTQNPQVLVEELKLIIDRDNLKAN